MRNKMDGGDLFGTVTNYVSNIVNPEDKTFDINETDCNTITVKNYKPVKFFERNYTSFIKSPGMILKNNTSPNTTYKCKFVTYDNNNNNNSIITDSLNNTNNNERSISFKDNSIYDLNDITNNTDNILNKTKKYTLYAIENDNNKKLFETQNRQGGKGKKTNKKKTKKRKPKTKKYHRK